MVTASALDYIGVSSMKEEEITLQFSLQQLLSISTSIAQGGSGLDTSAFVEEEEQAELSREQFDQLIANFGVDTELTFPVDATQALDFIETTFGDLPVYQTIDLLETASGGAITRD